MYCFGAGAEREVYIGSADLMTRNTEKRIEAACPVKDPKLAARILEILELELRDNVKARVLDRRGDQVRPARADGELPLDSQLALLEEALAQAPRVEPPRGW